MGDREALSLKTKIIGKVLFCAIIGAEQTFQNMLVNGLESFQKM